jgi:hypothetical protein
MQTKYTIENKSYWWANHKWKQQFRQTQPNSKQSSKNKMVIDIKLANKSLKKQKKKHAIFHSQKKLSDIISHQHDKMTFDCHSYYKLIVNISKQRCRINQVP